MNYDGLMRRKLAQQVEKYPTTKEATIDLLRWYYQHVKENTYA